MEESYKQQVIKSFIALGFLTAMVLIEVTMTSRTFRDGVKAWWTKLTSPAEHGGREPAHWEISRVIERAREITREATPRKEAP